MSTEQLVAIVTERLRTAMRDGRHAEAWDHGLYVLEQFDSSEQEAENQ